ncbi:kinase-like domain-containing protein [Syncephalastrum racemosum]|uniref:protein kinase C n=1 Tax=Syncephalastrum racemosum TaxID=13706 RepID=A0A1X2HGQ2_SYNRA|nr:kinase-like domain-containing protein [Syncephalastrum racemosum]
MSSPADDKAQDLQNKIELYKQYYAKAIQLRPLLKDRNAKEQCNTHIKELEKYVDYFTNELQKLQARSSCLSSSSAELSPTRSIESLRVNPAPGSPAAADHQQQQFPISAGAPNINDSSNIRVPTSSPENNVRQFTNLDLLTTEAPYNKAKVSLKLHELEYKIDVEKKLSDGIRNFARALDRDQSRLDRRRRDEIRAEMSENQEKLDLLNQALKKYKELYIDEGDDDIDLLDTPPSARLPPGIRRPVTGKLQLCILEARELMHAPTRLIRSPDTVVVVKIDGNVAFRTRGSRTDQWSGEQCEIHVNKASEVEVEIFDTSADKKLPIGVLWLKITDIADALRRKKIKEQDDTAGWVPANIAQQRTGASPESSSTIESPQMQRQPPTYLSTADDGILAWFDVEPLGKLLLRMNFVREASNHRPFDKLGRAGAVRQRREAVHERNGHQFVEHKFYNIMRCALCGEFLVNSGVQCEGCLYTCHKKCLGRIVTKCISKTKDEMEPEDHILNHRIPHRFEPIKNIGAHWCCHCGHMLPLGSSNVQRCSECNITCHTACAHLVPNFCGFSMDIASQMLAEIRVAKRKTPDQPNRPSLVQQKSMTEDSVDSLSVQASEISIEDDPHAPEHIPHLRMPPPGRSGADLYQQTATDGIGRTLQEYDSLEHYHQNEREQRVGLERLTKWKAPSQETAVAQVKIGLDDFDLLVVLGRGNFGKVMLAQYRKDKQVYAMKVLKKQDMVDNEDIQSARCEKQAFLNASREHHPFLVGLHSCFHTEAHVCFVMEYVNGGDLLSHRQRETFSERRTKFYASEVLLALEHLHQMGIVYRDLKLDNILVGADGHIKLTDYGLCKDNMFYGATTDTLCGTPEFMAPEILLDVGYDKSVDWWAFGVLIYQMLLGQSPFRGEDDDEIFNAIINDEILYPLTMSKNSISLCSELLVRDPTRRLGASEADAEDIKAHPFFKGIDWDNLLNKETSPPFYPTVVDALDTSNFDEMFTSEDPVVTPMIGPRLSREEEEAFADFSYIAEWA